MTEIRTNDLDLKPDEQAAVARIAERMKADVMSLYRTSEGLRAYITDTGGGEHLGVPIGVAVQSDLPPGYRAPLFDAGEQVTVTSVDVDGFQGRDPHPEPERKGQTGRVIDLVDSEWTDDGFMLHFYAVRFPDHSIRIMVEYEIS